MSPAQGVAPAFWPAGGDVLASGRPLPLREAEDLERFYLAAHDAALKGQDVIAAAYLFRRHAELSAALRSAARWRRAGARVGA